MACQLIRALHVLTMVAGLCASPSKDLRRLSARSVGRLAWNGGVEDNVISYLARNHWRDW